MQTPSNQSPTVYLIELKQYVRETPRVYSLGTGRPSAKKIGPLSILDQ